MKKSAHHTYKKKITPKTKKKTTKSSSFFSFLATRNGRLLTLIIITLMIPLTVMGIGEVQHLIQEAAPAVTQPCDASQLLNANPRPATRGQEIIFSHTDGPITVEMFENEDFLGNGVDNKTCTHDATNGWIKCTAKGNDKSRLKKEDGTPYSNHTWTFRNVQCNYEVLIPKNTNPKPTNPPKPTVTRPPGGFCIGSLTAGNEVGCDANQKPRMRVSWDMRGGTDGKCQALLEQGNNKWILGNKCDNRDGTYVKEDINRRAIDLKPNTKYTLTITNGSNTCNKVSETTTANCGTNTTPTRQPAATNTPVPGNNQNNAVQCNVYQQNPGSVNAGQQCVNNGEFVDCRQCPTPTLRMPGRPV